MFYHPKLFWAITVEVIKFLSHGANVSWILILRNVCPPYFCISAFVVDIIHSGVNFTFTFCILGTEIIFVTLGAEWLCTIYEDFLYITVRSQLALAICE